MIDAIKTTDAFQGTLDLLKKMGWLPKNQKVFIKPNIGATSLKVNTSPNIVRGLIAYLQSLGISDIVIGEGSVETEYESTPYNFRHQGWNKLAWETKVQLVDLNHAERVDVPWHYGTIALPKIMFGRSYINVAKMKTHMQTGVSLCTKNQKGLLSSQTRKQFHKLGLHKPIAELAKVIAPELCIVDGIVGIEGNGPGDLGSEKKVGVIVAGTDMNEVDVTVAKFMGFSSQEVPHLKMVNGGSTPYLSALFLTKITPFKKPDVCLKMFRTDIKFENACSACLSSVGKTNKLSRQSGRGVSFFLKHGFMGKLHIIVGNPSKVPSDGYLLFYGDCARNIAKQYANYPFVGGCPPVSNDVLRVLEKAK